MVALKGFGSFLNITRKKQPEAVYVCDVWFGSFHSKNYIPENAIKPSQMAGDLTFDHEKKRLTKPQSVTIRQISMRKKCDLEGMASGPANYA